MASPNYLQYENTYQKYKNICHNKDVTTFRDSNLNYCGGASGSQQQQQQQYAYDYHNHNNVDHDDNDRFDNFESKAENTMQTLSSDDEGGFRQDMLCMKNQFNNPNNSVNNCNGNTNGNAYSTKEIEPLLHSSNHNRESIQMTKVRTNIKTKSFVRFSTLTNFFHYFAVVSERLSRQRSKV